MKAKFLTLMLSLALISGAIADNIVFPPGGGGGTTSSTQVLNPISFGAKCIGVTNDDTAALQLWAAALNAGNNVGYVPGKCTTTLPIAFWPNGAVNAGLIGDGATSALTYTGANTTNDVFTIGQANVAASGCSMYNLSIRSVTFFSLTVMTAGTGLKINEGCQTDMSNVNVGTNLGASVGWYNAMWFNGGNTLHVRGYQFVGSNDAVAMNGDTASAPGPYQFTDPMFTQGVVIGGVNGFHIGGAVGGLVVDQTDALLNHTNVLIDQSLTARANLQLYFLGGYFSDATSGGAGVGVDVQDPGSTNSLLFFNNSWLASSTNECLKLESGVRWLVSMHGGEVYNCHGAGGIWNNSINTVISIEGTLFDFNGSGGLNNVVANTRVTLQGIFIGSNGNNGTVGNVVSKTYVNGSNNLISTSATTGAVLSGTTQVVGTTGNCSVWYQTGLSIPGASDFSAAGCTFSLGNVTFPFTTLAVKAHIAAGTPPAVTGCTVNAQAGGNTSGVFTFNGACAAPITLTFATTAPTGWSCQGSDMASGVLLKQNGFSTTTAAFVNPAAAGGDQVQFSCTAY